MSKEIQSDQDVDFISDDTKSKGEEYSLYDKKETLWDIGFEPFMFKLIEKSYRTSSVAMTGVCLKYGFIEMHIGPQNNGTKVIKEPTPQLLEMIGLNPFAIPAVVKDFCDSKVKRTGIEVKIDKTVIRVGKGKFNEIVR